MVTAHDVLEYISQAGPVLPKHVAEAFGISTLFASAFLSELSAKKSIKTSHLKIGGSPLYYTDEHRDRLVDYRANLHEKEQKTFEMLRSERILDDSKLELLDRVALRKMEDFAVPLAVDVGGTRRIFWKYYLAADDEAANAVSELLSSEQGQTQSAASSAAHVSDSGSNVEPEPSLPEPSEQAPTKPSIASPQTAEPPEGHEQAIPPTAPERDELAAEETPERAKSTTTPEPTKKPEGQKNEPEKPKERREAQARIPVENVRITHAPDATEALTTDPLGKDVLAYFNEKGIGIIEAEVVRKNTCLGVCSVPSPIGDLDYYFYAKEKKSITDKDVKEAFAEAAILGYPLLYIAKGDVKKNATELIGSKIKGSIIIEL